MKMYLRTEKVIICSCEETHMVIGVSYTAVDETLAQRTITETCNGIDDDKKATQQGLGLWVHYIGSTAEIIRQHLLP